MYNIDNIVFFFDKAEPISSLLKVKTKLFLFYLFVKVLTTVLMRNNVVVVTILWAEIVSISSTGVLKVE